MVRVRYAPSPTGVLHLGGLRTALYNQLVARQHSGSFLLRIEDTDRTRLVPGSADRMRTALHQCGIEFDGDVTVQSRRLHLYHDAVNDLLQRGHAYRCWCSPDRLALLRSMRLKQGLPPIYDRHCMHLSSIEQQKRLKSGVPHVIRMMIPEGRTTVRDIIRGSVSFDNHLIDDQILMKSDGFPTYHLASVVDDHDMNISHVIRGEEWLSSTPKHVIMYRQFGFQLPSFAHLPLLLTESRAKLSKRHGDAVAVDYLLQQGHLPEAILNFVVLMGWHPSESGDHTLHNPESANVSASRIHEVLTMGDMVSSFSLERVQKASAVVTFSHLGWLGNQHFRALVRDHPQEVIARVRSKLQISQDAYPDPVLLRILNTVADSAETLLDVQSIGNVFFDDPDFSTANASRLRERVWSENSVSCIRAVITALSSLSDSQVFQASVVEQELRGLQRTSKLFPLLRYCLTAQSKGFGVPTIVATLGKTEVIRRLYSHIDESHHTEAGSVFPLH